MNHFRNYSKRSMPLKFPPCTSNLNYLSNEYLNDHIFWLQLLPEVTSIESDEKSFLPVDSLAASDSKGATAAPLLWSGKAVDHRIPAVPAPGAFYFAFKWLHRCNILGHESKKLSIKIGEWRETTCMSISWRLISILAMKRSQNPAGTKLILKRRLRVLWVCWRKPWMSRAGLGGSRWGSR